MMRASGSTQLDKSQRIGFNFVSLTFLLCCRDASISTFLHALFGFVLPKLP